MPSLAADLVANVNVDLGKHESFFVSKAETDAPASKSSYTPLIDHMTLYRAKFQRSYSRYQMLCTREVIHGTCTLHAP